MIDHFSAYFFKKQFKISTYNFFFYKQLFFIHLKINSRQYNIISHHSNHWLYIDRSESIFRSRSKFSKNLVSTLKKKKNARKRIGIRSRDALCRVRGNETSPLWDEKENFDRSKVIERREEERGEGGRERLENCFRLGSSDIPSRSPSNYFLVFEVHRGVG